VNDFPQLLKVLRESQGLSQSRLADMGDFDHSYVSRLESGQRLPTRATVHTLAKALGLGEEEEKTLLLSAGFATAGAAYVTHSILLTIEHQLKVLPETRKAQALATLESLAALL
jgi:transcriptional regulator with XRE-family HTH domain